MLTKTHLVIVGESDDYQVRWIKLIKDTRPLIDSHGYFTFYIVVGNQRVEVKTNNMNYLIERAKKNTSVRGRGKITLDTAMIYLKEECGETLIATVVRIHTRKYAPVYDEI